VNKEIQSPVFELSRLREKTAELLKAFTLPAPLFRLLSMLG
jgi:hypothetical protein